MIWTEDQARQRVQQLDDMRILAVIREASQPQPGSDRRWCTVAAILAALHREMGSDPEDVDPALEAATRERLQAVIASRAELRYVPGG